MWHTSWSWPCVSPTTVTVASGVGATCAKRAAPCTPCASLQGPCRSAEPCWAGLVNPLPSLGQPCLHDGWFLPQQRTQAVQQAGDGRSRQHGAGRSYACVRPARQASSHLEGPFRGELFRKSDGIRCACRRRCIGWHASPPLRRKSTSWTPQPAPARSLLHSSGSHHGLAGSCGGHRLAARRPPRAGGGLASDGQVNKMRAAAGPRAPPSVEPAALDDRGREPGPRAGAGQAGGAAGRHRAWQERC